LAASDLRKATSAIAAALSLPRFSSTASCRIGWCSSAGTIQAEPLLSWPFSHTCDSATKPSSALPLETKPKAWPMLSPCTIFGSSRASTPSRVIVSRAAAP
jgi:hypothetical protein